MRVVIADPPAYTPPYDHALAAALLRPGLEIRLLSSRFRFGAVPPPAGFTLDDGLYRLAAMSGSARARLAARSLGHPRALVKLASTACDVLHLQWVAAPEVDAWLLHVR